MDRAGVLTNALSLSMFTAHYIENFDLPELQPYRTMRRQLEQRQAGIFVAEGEKIVRRLLESPLEVISVLLPEKWFSDLEPLLRVRPEEVRVFIAEKGLLETLTGFSMYQGLLACARVPKLPTLEQLLARAQQPLLLVAVEGLSSAENLGAVVRNCAGLGAGGLVVGETCVSPFLRRAVRSSMGAVLHLPIVESSNLVQSLHQLRAAGVRCIAAHPQPGSKALSQVDLRGPCCILLGSEGYGISPAGLRACDVAAVVPMPSHVDSLNVGSAAAVFLYEVNRQRGKT